jgi:hypothetical protein
MIVLRRYLAVLALLACSSYSYSEEVFGTSQNAAQTGLNWVMTNVLPQQAGLTVNSVIYRYTAVKDPATGMIVYVQNENAQGPGYIFRSVDDWSGLPGNTINKVVSVANIPRELWGDGSIEVDGQGFVTDASVVYGYQYDPCFDPQTSPDCPGYKDPFLMELMEPEIVDPLDDDLLQKELDRKAALRDEDQEERVLGIVNETLLAAEAQALAAELLAMNFIPQAYYTTIPDTKYEETVILKDTQLPKNPRSQRLGLAQQLLHEELVNSQYEKK